MCTMGAVFERNGNFTFKQCDLMEPAMFLEPTHIETNRDVIGEKGAIEYLALERQEQNGQIKCWGGINNYGVSFVEADSYLREKKDGQIVKKMEKVTLEMCKAYKEVIAECTSAKSGAEKIIKFFKQNAVSNIIIIGDDKEIYFIEVKYKEIVCVRRQYKEYSMANYLAATNHLRYIHGAVSYEQDHSTYLRLQRAETLLSEGMPSKQIASVLSDQYYGETVLSICGVKGKGLESVPDEEPYYTQASVIFYAGRNSVSMAYLLNGNPGEHEYTIVEDVFNQQGRWCKHEHISTIELKRWLGKSR